MPLSFRSVVSALTEHRLLSLIVFVLSALSVDFVLRFCVPAVSLNRSLERTIRLLCSRKLRAVQQVGIDLSAMVGDATYSYAFDRPWREFCKTLHPQRHKDGAGGYEVIKWRSTCLAEVFFTDKALVDTPLRTEYFAHLPGILTGVGIIGTFRGLIEGLKNFLPSLDPNAMQGEINSLIGIVANAFLTSAAAIALAILFTMTEKVLLNSCYRKVEALQQIVDRMFRSGAGEEYLEVLAGASGAYATQAMHLKDELFSDLRDVLNDVARTQVEAVVRSGRDSSNRVAEVIVQRVGDPINNISEAVKYLGAIVAQLSSQMTGLMEEQRRERTTSLDNAVNLVRILAREVEKLVASAAATTELLQGSLSSFVSASHDEIGRMASATELLYTSSSELAKSGGSAAVSIGGLSDAMDRFQEANRSLERSVTSMAQTVDGYEKDRNAFQETLSGLRVIVDNAKKEASLTSEMLASIGGAATQLASAGMQSEAYLGKVNDVLAKAHVSFAENIDKTLNHGNARFHVELAKAVDLLAGGIRDLEDALSALPGRNQ